MNREIKFRAWDKKNETMHSYDIDNDAMFVVLPDGDVCSAGTSVEGGTGEHVWTVCEESNENLILMQFTGLHDKNGKEIYEGDIVKYKVAITGKRASFDRIGEVVYYTELASFRMKGKDEINREILSSHSEIVGNIYENPNLLEVQ